MASDRTEFTATHLAPQTKEELRIVSIKLQQSMSVFIAKAIKEKLERHRQHEQYHLNKQYRLNKHKGDTSDNHDLVAGSAQGVGLPQEGHGDEAEVADPE